MKLLQASWLLLVISTFYGCSNGANTVGQKTSTLTLDDNTHFCEIIYAPHPHKTAVKAIGAQRLNKTLSLSFADMVYFSEAFMPMTQSIVESVIAQDSAKIDLLSHEVMLGGYEGESIPSVVIKTRLHGKENAQTLLKVAAKIGYIYAQDSVLVICDDNIDGAFQATTSIELTDQGKETFLNQDNAPLLFGMMMGAHNRVEGLGYSYYKESKVFSTFVDLTTQSQEMQVINDLVNWLENLSHADISLKVTPKPIWIFFPHNTWSTDQQGQGYYQYLDGMQSSEQLLEKRQQFLDKIDQVLAELA
ncbi:hypothetical protein SAMN05216262_10576 [Colwellia chukchiensis]|uniref:Uncharacterized protein n=1 Tax=Colwellia chukchiensis TaxID=641665 RepID=A0A1H7M3S9_9GAMM|nr:hypothetical protein [Colwellia chukchiensis]SEL05739.1 hypothetical protein SAMN05216262_10576 [Colwellia chukchiensis]